MVTDPADLEVLRFEGRRSTGVWGAAAGAGVVGIVLAYFLYGYLYLSVSSDDWPPAGVADPPLARTVALLAVVASAALVSVWAARSSARPGADGGATAALGAVGVLGAVFVGLGAAHVAGLDLEPRHDAYSAIVVTVHGIQGAATVAGVLIAGLTAFESRRLGRHPWVGAATVVSCIWWCTLLAGWVAVFGVVYVWPQWS